MVVGATVRLVGLPVEFSAAVATFPSVEAASKVVYEIMRAGLNPAAMELLGPECVDLMNKEENLDLIVSPTLFMEFHGSTTSQLAEVLELSEEICKAGECTQFQPGLGRSERDRIFKARHALGEMIARNHPDCGIMVLDVAVPITAYAALITDIRKELAGTNLVSYYISHAGNGNVHLNILGKKVIRKNGISSNKSPSVWCPKVLNWAVLRPVSMVSGWEKENTWLPNMAPVCSG